MPHPLRGLLAGALWATTTSALAYPRQENDTFAEPELPSFNWTSITPSQDLQYHNCYNGHRCARLKLPLDWTEYNKTAKRYSNATEPSTWVAIGIVTLPATVPEKDPSHGGTVILNPGGPAALGTQMVLDQGKYLQSIIDSPGRKHFELLGFDPRGVGVSTPSAACYADPLLQMADQIQLLSLPSAFSGGAAFRLQYDTWAAMGRLCAETGGEDGIFGHMSTASVARDMFEIVERVEELRAKKTKPTKKKKEMGEYKAEPGLQYMGFSYGTVLGNTFASMFPGRVKRMVLDGVVDAEDYLTRSGKKMIIDAEEAVNNFYQTCFDAGSQNCPLRLPSDTTPSALRDRVNTFIETLETANPIPVVNNGRVQLLTSNLVRDTIRRTFYSPVCSYEPVALALAESILSGNHALLLSGNGNQCSKLPASWTPHNRGDFACPWCGEAGLAIYCGDSAAATNSTGFSIEQARALAASLREQSPTTFEPWTSFLALPCADWQYKPTYAFNGPFGSTSTEKGGGGKGGAAPMLILSARYDHATPLENAFALSRMHEGSAVVVQESVGHVALSVSTSECTAKIVREYFDTGRLPVNGTSCAADCEAGIPFKACPGVFE